ncbi:C4-hydroxylase [Capronia epimyces CBS 606.96]|uniref:C4-hydroxylase n=1 Tax=Capronia epimyces CBS 606.96 TaxID=1182542 RepID=W9YYA7_9EURO|nr:C4-hydroxylase [Capronia epimyces CBS 606.96]EXJ87284.1 C4-hydroxylase [Capronia epimyces CBS 606.96]
MANRTLTDLPPLPPYTLAPRPPLISGVSDAVLQLLAPVVAYWVVSLFFHALDTYDLCSQYRLHTPAEVLKRNHVTRHEVVRDVIIQQVIQTAFGLLLASFDPMETCGKEEYDIAVWAQRLRLAERYIPKLFAVVGIDAISFAQKAFKNYPQLAGAVSGGVYSTRSFAAWEISAATLIYWVAIPFAQFLVAILIVDTWQYFLHRAMHMNKFLYTTLHSRHHRLYVPYAFGALYNHPLEGLLLDTLGTGLAYIATRMTLRQGLWFFTCSTIKTVDDHCGYAFPWDPLQHLTSNNAAYHDVHHQSWGIKTNFSQPFFTFWDRLLGTAWSGGDVSARYMRDRIAAQKKVDADTAADASIVNSPTIDLDKAKQQASSSQRQVLDDKANGGIQILQEEAKAEQEMRQTLRRSTRRKSGFDAMLISDRVSGRLHNRSPTILHADGVH